MTENGSRKPEAGSRLDVAIDRAVREMLDVEQPAGLRGRVLQRIEGADSRSGVASTFRWRFVWIAAPVAAAAILILALLPTRRAEPTRPTTVVQVGPVKTPPAGAPVVEPDPTPPAIVKAPRLVARSHRPAVATAPDRAIAATTFLAPEEGTTTIASLEAIDPIQVAPIAEHRTAPAEIVVRPLTEITEVQIAPLSPPERRN